MATDVKTFLDATRARYAAAGAVFEPQPDESIADEATRERLHAEALKRREQHVADARREIVAHAAAVVVGELFPSDPAAPAETDDPVAKAVNALAAAVLAAVKE